MRFSIQAGELAVEYRGFGSNRRRMSECAHLLVDMATALANEEASKVINAAVEMLGVPDDAGEL